MANLLAQKLLSVNQKSKEDHGRLVADPDAAVIVQKIFNLSAKGTGLNAIVRDLNENGIPTPIQYARSKGLKGSYADGNGSWNSRSVKNILMNRTYTGMLVQGKEKRSAAGTHEPLVDSDTFNAIQEVFQSAALTNIPKGQSAENILKGKVICGCCGGKMQRRRGSHHADWFFFSCIMKNRLGADKCSGMYVREEDIFHAIYNHLKTYVEENYIPDFQHQTRIKELDEQIAQYAKQSNQAWNNIKQSYETFDRGDLAEEKLREISSVASKAKEFYMEAVKLKEEYEKGYAAFCKLLAASRKNIPLSEIMDCIDQIVVDGGEKIVVKWNKHDI